MRNTILLLIPFLITLHDAFGQSVANFNISITTIWNTTEHTTLPNNAHWSPLVGATHKNPNAIIEFGIPAPSTNGIKDVAEIGVNTNFENEINTLISAGNANQYIEQAFAPFAGNTSTASLSNIEISEDFPLITLASMVAPSPDWFIAINSLNLRSGNNSINNGWKDTFTLDVFAYDAGTDSGTEYTSNNSITNPREPISMLSGYPINGNRMASITFQYNTSTLSSTQKALPENIKIYPNPSKGKITISNIQNLEISTVKIYSVLGSIIQNVTVENSPSKLEFDLSNLKKGIYLVRVTNINGNHTTRKLIIN
ncbi:spondin domain-containing protein [Algibacter pectinivorans]|uniref:Por secretion system C-terminal sorting domain-containing protein n=1 Tax=Algibacter pectinivorans TaxID=870482 RepID=A0A1I1RUW1_9FLAO|nr:spondin domain-containing protein [Algibacter pectinivorans]SFD38099.1 Por secretion system C-terminal sorting domain-containing protein [Algibacter pectinivorans]